MFCGECGTKNQKDARFCENCGAKLELPKKVASKTKRAISQKKANKENFGTKWKKMAKGKKILLGIILVLIIALIVLYAVISNKLSPSSIAKDYFMAIANVDADKLYEYMDIDKNEFTSKEMFVKLTARKADEEKIKLTNYKIGKVEKNEDGMTARVTISYIEEGNSNLNTANITLVKQKSKKYFLFDDWHISSNMAIMNTTKDYKIKVLKDSKVTIEGVVVDKKYIEEDSSNDTYDVYKIPTIFTEKYEMKIALPLGFEVEDTLNGSNYYGYTYEFDEDDLPEDIKNQIVETTKKGLQTLYDGAKDQKSFDDIKQAFAFTNSDLNDLKETYASLSKSLSNSDLSAIEFTEVTLDSISTTKDGYRASVKTKYKYTVSYTSGDEIKMHDSSGSDSMTIYYSYSDKAFRMIDASSLTTYFSRYY